MKKGISTLLTVCLTAVIVLAVAASGWYYLDKQNKEEKASLQARINELQTELAATTKTSGETATSTSSSTTASTADATAGWKTYTNTSGGYSFKYPTDWVLDTSIPNAVSVNSPDNEALRASTYEGYMADVYFYYYPTLADADGNNPKKYQTFSDWVNDSSYLAEMTSTTLAGQKAYEGIEGGFGAYYVILSSKNAHYFKIMFGNVETKGAENTTEKLILDSFRFSN